MKRSIFALLFFAVGCEPINPGPTGCGTLVDPLLAVTVTDAHLENVQVWQAGLVVGQSQGTANLIVDATDGLTRNFATTLTGEHSGLVVDASFDDTFGANIPLGLPAGALNARQLLGSYAGPHVGGDLGVGAQWLALKNDAGVALTLTSLSFGFGAEPATWDSLDVELVNDPAHFDGDILGPAGEGEGEGEGEGDGEGDGEGEGPAAVDENAACTVDADCVAGDACIPDSDHATHGTCHLRCGVVSRDGTSVNKDPSISCAGESCQAMTTLPSGAIVDVACFPTAPDRGDGCRALHDPNACAAGLECRIADVDADDNITSLRCKKPCTFDDDCAPTERCLASAASGETACGTPVASGGSCDEDADQYCALAPCQKGVCP